MMNPLGDCRCRKSPRGLVRSNRARGDPPGAPAAGGRRAESGDHHVGRGNARHVRPRSFATDKRHPNPILTGRCISVISIAAICTFRSREKRGPHRPLEVRDDRNSIPRGGHARDHGDPSLYWGDELIYDERQQTEVKNVDTQGRLWMGTMFRPPNNPAWCKEGSSNKYAQYFPIANSYRQLAVLRRKNQEGNVGRHLLRQPPRCVWGRHGPDHLSRRNRHRGGMGKTRRSRPRRRYGRLRRDGARRITTLMATGNMRRASTS